MEIEQRARTNMKLLSIHLFVVLFLFFNFLFSPALSNPVIAFNFEESLAPEPSDSISEPSSLAWMMTNSEERYFDDVPEALANSSSYSFSSNVQGSISNTDLSLVLPQFPGVGDNPIAFSLSIWVKLEITSCTEDIVLVEKQRSFRLLIDDNGCELTFSSFDPSAGFDGTFRNVKGSTIPSMKWVHLIIRQSSTSDVTFHVDSNTTTSRGLSMITPPSNGSLLLGPLTDIMIDELQIFDTFLEGNALAAVGKVFSSQSVE